MLTTLLLIIAGIILMVLGVGLTGILLCTICGLIGRSFERKLREDGFYD